MGLKTRKAAEVAEKRRVNAEMEARKHLLVKMGAERNVREAYLSGVVFAGLANDEEAPEIQSEEREILNGICESLDLDRSLIDAIITTEKSSIDDDTYMDLLCECLGLLTDIKLLDSFLEDFDRIWSVGKGNPSELKSWHNDFEEMVSADVAKALAERKSVEAKKAEEEKQRQAEAKRRAEEEDRKKERAAFDAWLEAISEQYGAMSTIPKGVPAELSRNANEFDVGKLDFDEIKQKILSGLKTCKRRKYFSLTLHFRPQWLRMAWKLLGYFALRFKLDDECLQVRSIKYLMKKTGDFDANETIVQSFKTCIEKYEGQGIKL